MSKKLKTHENIYIHIKKSSLRFLIIPLLIIIIYTLYSILTPWDGQMPQPELCVENENYCIDWLSLSKIFLGSITLLIIELGIAAWRGKLENALRYVIFAAIYALIAFIPIAIVFGLTVAVFCCSAFLFALGMPIAILEE